MDQSTNVMPKPYLLIDEWNGRTVPVTAEEIPEQLVMMGRRRDAAERCGDAVRERGVTLHARYAGCVITTNHLAVGYQQAYGALVHESATSIPEMA